MTRKISFRYELLNKNNQKIRDLTGVLSGSVALNALAEIKRTARFTIKDDEAIDYLNDRIRPIVILDGKEYAMGVYLIPSPTKNVTKNGVIRSIEAYDVCQILKEDKFVERYFMKKGSRYIEVIQRIINSAGIYEVELQNSTFILNRDREFEIGKSKLSAVNELLSEMNYTSLYADRNGVLKADYYVLPQLKPVKHNYTDKNSKIIAYSLNNDLDLFNVPNYWLIIVSNGEGSNLVARYENKNSISKTSTINRGRRIVDFREVSDISNQTALDDYVKRLAVNASSQYDYVNFSTMINPEHDYFEAMWIKFDAIGTDSKFVEVGWEINLKAGGTMTHKTRKVVNV